VVTQRNPSRLFGSVLEKRGIDQIVVDDDIGLLEALDAPQGDESRITWPGTHEIHGA
jgi:septum formation inhibitor-activating ATPase MinD